MSESGDLSADIFMVAILMLYWVLLRNWSRTHSQDNSKANHEDASATQKSACFEEPPVSSTTASVIQEVDRNFNAAAFLAGAQTAYEVVLQTYSQGDIETLKRFVGPDVFKTFERAIEGRLERQETLQLMFIGMRKAAIFNAAKKGEAIEIGVRFVADVVTATRSAGGMIVAGDAQQVVQVADAWTFARKIRSRNPDWKLVATGSF